MIYFIHAGLFMLYFWIEFDYWYNHSKEVKTNYNIVFFLASIWGFIVLMWNFIRAV